MAALPAELQAWLAVIGTLVIILLVVIATSR